MKYEGHLPPNKTDSWKQMVNEDIETGKYFWNTPPVPSAYRSERILVVGSEDETEYLRPMIDDLKGKNGVRVDYTSDAGHFWEKFFHKKAFLDGLKGRTVPKRIWATGYIQTPYISGIGGKKTRTYAGSRIEEIAGQWNIEISFIRPFKSRPSI